jgi:hypothetical protein
MGNLIISSQTGIKTLSELLGWVDVRGYGAVGDGAADDTVAIQAAINSITSGIILFPSGTYKVTDSIIIANDRVIFVGMGRNVSSINFVPTAHDKPCIRFKAIAAVPIVQCGIRDLGIYSTNSTYRKIGIQLVDISGFSLTDVSINGTSYFHDSANASIGLQIKGRDTSSIIHLSSHADIPIQIDENPNHANLDCDHINFHNTYLIATSTNPCVKVTDGVYLTNLSFTGYQAWASGGYGFYWPDTTTTGNSASLILNNIRWEQSNGNTGYFIYIKCAGYLQSFVMNNCRYSTIDGIVDDTNGIYLRGVKNGSIIDCVIYPTVPATRTTLNIDATCSNIQIRNTKLYELGTISVGNLIPKEYHFGTDGTLNANYVQNTISDVQLLTVNDATPSIKLGNNFYTKNTNPTTITNLDDPYIGKKVTVLFQDTNTTIDFTGSNMAGHGGVDFTAAVGDWMECVYDGNYSSYWYCAVHDISA